MKHDTAIRILKAHGFIKSERDERLIREELKRLEFDGRATWAAVLDEFTGIVGRTAGVNAELIRHKSAYRHGEMRSWDGFVRVSPEDIRDWDYLMRLRARGLDPYFDQAPCENEEERVA